MSGRFDILPGFPPDVLAISGHGRIDSNDYEETLVPALQDLLTKEGKAKLYYMLDEDYAGYTAGGALQDTKLGLTHLHDFTRIAVVTDVEWIRAAVHLFGPLMRAPVRVFGLAEQDAAKAWISENHAPESFTKVAADHRVTTPRS